MAHPIAPVVRMTQTPVRFGVGHSLVGMVTTPAGQAPAAAACLMFNMGANHRIGPRRINVKLAARGVGSLRFDLGGIGDSDAPLTAADLPSRAVHDLQAGRHGPARRHPGHPPVRDRGHVLGRGARHVHRRGRFTRGRPLAVRRLRVSAAAHALGTHAAARAGRTGPPVVRGQDPALAQAPCAAHRGGQADARLLHRRDVAGGHRGLVRHYHEAAGRARCRDAAPVLGIAARLRPRPRPARRLPVRAVRAVAALRIHARGRPHGLHGEGAAAVPPGRGRLGPAPTGLPTA